MSITLRRLDSVEDAEHFSRLEQLIWNSPPEECVPIHVTITVIRNGGGLIGAFADDGPAETGGMVGLTFCSRVSVPLAPHPSPVTAPPLT